MAEVSEVLNKAKFGFIDLMLQADNCYNVDFEVCLQDDYLIIGI